MRVRLLVVVIVWALGSAGCVDRSKAPSEPSEALRPSTESSCFLLYEVGTGEVRRSPSAACATRITPASTFKIPHALAGLDSGVLTGAEDRLPYDGAPAPFESWRRAHTLASAMRNSVVWYFQRVATKLGPDREAAYLSKFDYGNANSSSGLTTFWLGGSLLISPDEQERFLSKLYSDGLPVKKDAQRIVRDILVQPPGVVVNATGEHPFAGPWPAGTVLSAKTGSATNHDGREVRWIVGHVQRLERSWIFVSCVSGDRTLRASAAIDLAADALRKERVLEHESTGADRHDSQAK
jgi:beta-lactamase class D